MAEGARVLYYTVLLDFVCKRGFRKTHFSKLRPCTRAYVQKPIARISVDFASPKVTGSKKGGKHLPPAKASFFAKFTKKDVPAALVASH